MTDIDFGVCRGLRIEAICKHICSKADEVIKRIPSVRPVNEQGVLNRGALSFFCGPEWVNKVEKSEECNRRILEESTKIAHQIAETNLLAPVLEKIKEQVPFLEPEKHIQILILLNASFNFPVKARQGRPYIPDNSNHR